MYGKKSVDARSLSHTLFVLFSLENMVTLWKVDYKLTVEKKDIFFEQQFCYICSNDEKLHIIFDIIVDCFYSLELTVTNAKISETNGKSAFFNRFYYTKDKFYSTNNKTT